MKKNKNTYLFVTTAVLVVLWATRIFHAFIYFLLQDKPIFFYRGQLAEFWLNMPNHNFHWMITLLSFVQGIILIGVSRALLNYLSEQLHSNISISERLNAFSAYLIGMASSLLVTSFCAFALRLKLSGISIKPFDISGIGMTEYLSGLSFLPWLVALSVLGVIAVVFEKRSTGETPSHNTLDNGSGSNSGYKLAA